MCDGLRYRRALPNSGWRLLQGPALFETFTAPRISFSSFGEAGVGYVPSLYYWTKRYLSVNLL